MTRAWSAAPPCWAMPGLSRQSGPGRAGGCCCRTAGAVASLLGYTVPRVPALRGCTTCDNNTVSCWAGLIRVASVMAGRSSAKSPAGIGMQMKAGLLPPRCRLLGQLRCVWRWRCIPRCEGIPPHWRHWHAGSLSCLHRRHEDHAADIICRKIIRVDRLAESLALRR